MCHETFGFLYFDYYSSLLLFFHLHFTTCTKQCFFCLTFSDHTDSQQLMDGSRSRQFRSVVLHDPARFPSLRDIALPPLAEGR